jgi:SAM-dependent methyltransferase
MRISTITRPLVALLGAAVLVTGPAAQNKDIPGEAARLLKELNVSAGGTVADIGAGEGEMTVELARQLGPTGRLYSTDINSKTVESLKALVAKERLENVVVLQGDAERTNLPDGCCDGAFARYVYHHFGQPAPMNASIRRSLKAGGRFAVIDAAPKAAPHGGVAPDKRSQGDTHGVASEDVIAELTAAGFVDVHVTPDWPGGLFLVRATNPRSADGTGRGTGR